MYDRKSDYALNKTDPDAIVFKTATGPTYACTGRIFPPRKNFSDGKAGLTRIIGLWISKTTPIKSKL